MEATTGTPFVINSPMYPNESEEKISPAFVTRVNGTSYNTYILP
jgi:hypothetical protein